MGIIPTLNTFVAGTPIVASAMNSNFDEIVAVVNGGIDDSNVSQISASKVTSGEFHPDRIPRLSEDKLPRAEQGFLKATGTSTNPTYELVQWGDVQAKPAQATRWPTWSEVTSKPSTFPSTWGTVADKPSTATRWPMWDEVTGKPVRFPSTWDTLANKPATATRWPTWDEVTIKPTTATRWPAWGEVTGKPSTFPSTWNDVASKPVTATRWPTWSEVTSKPATATRWPTWNEVTSKPIGAGSADVAPGQGILSPAGALTEANNRVGVIRLITWTGTAGATVAAGTLVSSPKLALLSTQSNGALRLDEDSVGTLPGSWRTTHAAVTDAADNRIVALAVRTS